MKNYRFTTFEAISVYTLLQQNRSQVKLDAHLKSECTKNNTRSTTIKQFL